MFKKQKCFDHTYVISIIFLIILRDVPLKKINKNNKKNVYINFKTYLAFEEEEFKSWTGV